MKNKFKMMHKRYLPKSKYYTKGFFNINTTILVIFFKILTLKNEIIMLVNGFKKQYQQEECIWCKGDYLKNNCQFYCADNTFRI